jgi:hypothetical protein
MFCFALQFRRNARSTWLAKATERRRNVQPVARKHLQGASFDEPTDYWRFVLNTCRADSLPPHRRSKAAYRHTAARILMIVWRLVRYCFAIAATLIPLVRHPITSVR